MPDASRTLSLGLAAAGKLAHLAAHYLLTRHGAALRAQAARLAPTVAAYLLPEERAEIDAAVHLALEGPAGLPPAPPSPPAA